MELEGERLLTRAFPEVCHEHPGLVMAAMACRQVMLACALMLQVDAALAAIIWVERRDPDQRAFAETLWNSALQLDTRLAQLEYVAESLR